MNTDTHSQSTFSSKLPSELGRGLALLLCLFLSALFIYSGIVKLLDLSLFTEQVRTFQILPDPFNTTLALILPPLEILMGVALWIPKFKQGARLIGIILTFVFLVALGVSWARGLDISCGCFGSKNKTNYPSAIFLDITLLLAFLVLKPLWLKFDSNI